MGAKPSSLRSRILAHRDALEKRDVAAIVATFADDATLMFYNVQDRRPVVFKGKKQLEGFFNLYIQTVPAFRVDLGVDKEKEKEAEKQKEGADAAGKDGADNGNEEKDAIDDTERAAMEEAADLASHDTSVAEAKLVACYFDDPKHIASVTYRCPAKGYRFVQEHFVSDKEVFAFVSITMDSSTDYTGLALLDNATADEPQKEESS
ncbi:Hypothetical Protein FCC1311_026982 [Hondaea fermentalgiana]|uniref:SnoaL-like domain-containing protein n=1 Tax=Hondaea fermentalgiana TaxID=2315210 RepID=A0A2R5G603_9STRA|nr:Hypothetical Protein FCC1311_026982 [Hondaea fermentalgiana]|eukprot:GBG26477.1 Hypothetical Protein FCC1311_026982 [Hondaea fermentalgiana]